MRINDLTLNDVKQGRIYRYANEDSQEIVLVENFFGKVEENTGYYLITGEVKLNDGTIYPAIFGISSDDSGEMFEYHFLTEKRWISSTDDVCYLLNKKKTEIYPFKYNLNCKILGDIHTDEQY